MEIDVDAAARAGGCRQRRRRAAAAAAAAANRGLDPSQPEGRLAKYAVIMWR